MDKNQAQVSVKNLYGEVFNLNPSSLITLFEIDIGDIGFNRSIITQKEVDKEINTIFRFHNNIKLTNSSIFWKGKEYIAAPIIAEGFEIGSNGTLPTPRLSLTVNEEGIPHLALFKDKILQLGDIIGAKVTRIRTFAKFIDQENFFGSNPPNGFSPDQNSELPRDIFYIDRKSNENKFTLEFELASILDVEGKKLPGRLVLQNSCPHLYRGEGCLYEYNSRRNEDEHGDESESSLPDEAPPIANYFDEEIPVLLSGIQLNDKGKYNSKIKYNSGDFCYLEHNNIKYYFVANGVDVTVSPPDTRYWIKDECSHRRDGCNLRYGLNGSAVGNVVRGVLPFGGFISVNRFR